VGILLGYPNDLFRQAIAEMLQAEHSTRLEAVVDNYPEAARLATANPPDVVLLGFDDQAGSPGELRDAAAALHGQPVAIFATVTRPGTVEELLTLNASAYLLNGINRHEMLFALHLVARRTSRTVILAPTNMITGAAHTGRQVSARELEVLRLVARGLSNRQIASALQLTEGTVKRHLHGIYGKLDAHSRTDAVRAALSRGLLALADMTD